MFKRVLFFLIFLFLFSQSQKIAYAINDFSVTTFAEYKVEETGKTQVTNTKTKKNSTSQLLAKSYTLNISGGKPKNIKAFEEGKKLSVFQLTDADSTKLRVDFEDTLPGIRKTRTFIITYEEDSLATKTGDVWEVFIPKLANPQSFTTYKVLLSTQKSFGEEAYIATDEREVKEENDRKIFIFQKEDLTSGISVGFGKYQVFSFTLNYHLENTSNKKTQLEIAIPPDTSTQKMFYESIDPKPVNIYQDSDGNWITVFSFSPRQKKLVKVKGFVQIFSKPRKFIQPTSSTLLENTKSQDVWQTEDPGIYELAKTLKTPEEIYKYVTETLVYDFERVKPEAERYGAKKALANPRNAICTEFTDLFIALARANGIPAREINGYAYSENPKIQPLSFVSDVLHAWPEYWDASRATWIPVDPTWGSTSGVDYFNKLDLRHFAFVIHGKNAFTPYSAGSYKLGDDPQKDVFVSFGELPNKRTSSVTIQTSFPKNFFLFSKNVKITISNPGPVAVYDLIPQIIFDDKVVSSNYIPQLPPFANFETSFKIPYGLLAKKAPTLVSINAYRSEIFIPTNKNQSIISQILTLAFLLIIIIIFTYIRLTHIRIFEILLKQKFKLSNVRFLKKNKG